MVNYNILRTSKVKLVLGCFAFMTFVLYWNILSMTSNNYISKDQFAQLEEQNGLKFVQVDYGSQQTNCRFICGILN